MVSDVYKDIMTNPDCFGFSIIENEVPIGIITKEKLTMHLSGHYGFSLHQNKNISEIMDKDFLIC